MSAVPRGIFVTSTGTDAGKTYLTRALASLLAYHGRNVLAVKPIETGTAPDPLDALALARACGRPAVAKAPGLYRAVPPLSPYAVTLATGQAAPDLEQLVRVVGELGRGADFVLVEGAGGLLVPLDAGRCIADLALALGLPLLLVARDALGVLSSVLTCYESAERRGLRVAAVILTTHERASAGPDAAVPDPSCAHNAAILAERLPCPVLRFPYCDNDDDALAHAAEALDLPRVLGLV